MAERRKQFADARHQAVLIDEINRGNVARIFGELITLEDEKRLGGDNEVIVQLPYSQKRSACEAERRRSCESC